MRLLLHFRNAAIVVSVAIAGAAHSPGASAETIAIIGTDAVAAALGPEFAALGHEVIYGSRDPNRDKVRQLVRRTGDNASAMRQAEAAASADIVMLAVPWDVIEEVVDNLGDLSGKIIIDPTNPRAVGEDGLRWYAREISNAELLQQWAPRAHVVKAFNTMSAETMAEPATAGGPVSVPIVGNDAAAKQKVASLISGIGLEPVDLGPIRYARIVEGMYYLRSNARMLGHPFNYHLRKQPETGAQTSWERKRITNPAWTTAFPPVQIVGNLYYVGTYELASFLITTPEGHLLVNSGAYGSEHLIRANVEALGFDFEDIGILLTTQAHWDHVAALAEIKRLTGAQLYAHEGDVPSLQDGGSSGFGASAQSGAVFEPVIVDEVLSHGDTIELGGTVVTLLHHPGHTKGASSFAFTTREAGRDYAVLIVNMGTVNDGVTLLGMERYPGIAADYAATFAAQKELAPDIWVSSHARHFRLHDKYQVGDPYDAERFLDPDGYLEMIETFERRYLNQLAEERAARR
jgi:metallo-beta-lactamase class B